MVFIVKRPGLVCIPCWHLERFCWWSRGEGEGWLWWASNGGRDDYRYGAL